jgi:hypothetical protein
MATWADVRRVAMALPETVETGSADNGNLVWTVRRKGFLWERPLGKKDLNALGDAAPTGPILAARVPDVGAVDALLADDPDIYFTTPHFQGYAAVLIRLPRIRIRELRELALDAWLQRAPKRLARSYLAEAGLDR